MLNCQCSAPITCLASNQNHQGCMLVDYCGYQEYTTAPRFCSRLFRSAGLLPELTRFSSFSCRYYGYQASLKIVRGFRGLFRAATYTSYYLGFRGG